MFILGMVLVASEHGKLYCHDIQNNGNNEIRNTQIRVFSGVLFI